MRCPYCKSDKDRVVDSRSGEDGLAIRRRRKCLVCGKRYTSYERLEPSPLKVVKKDGRRAAFDPTKIRQGIEKACWNLPVSTDEIERIVARIVSGVAENHDREVSSRELGDLVMKELRAVSEVAYVRFASVYREFRDVTEFRKLLEEFVKGAERDREVSGETPAGDLPASPAAEPPPRRTGATRHPEGGRHAGDRKG